MDIVIVVIAALFLTQLIAVTVYLAVQHHKTVKLLAESVKLQQEISNALHFIADFIETEVEREDEKEKTEGEEGVIDGFVDADYIAEMIFKIGAINGIYGKFAGPLAQAFFGADPTVKSHRMQDGKSLIWFEGQGIDGEVYHRPEYIPSDIVPDGYAVAGNGHGGRK